MLVGDVEAMCEALIEQGRERVGLTARGCRPSRGRPRHQVELVEVVEGDAELIGRGGEELVRRLLAGLEARSGGASRASVLSFVVGPEWAVTVSPG